MAKTKHQAGTPGAGEYDGLTYTELLETDAGTVPDFLSREQFAPLGFDEVPVEHFTSQEFFNLEAERMWPRVWQMACREEDIPRPGDFHVYEILDWSLLIARQDDGSIKAFYNSCLHRGRKLKTKGGSAKQFRCPFHGFTWNTDGSLKRIPCPWDFPQVKPADFTLPEARVDTWAGFVFVNMDADAMPLADYLDVLPEHFEGWDLANTSKVVHVGKIVPANWKATAEAFMEAYHAEVTHPQIMPYSGDINGRYDIYGDHVSRNITPMATPSPVLGDKRPAEQEILDELVGTSGRIIEEEGGDKLLVPEGMTARAFMAQMNRNAFAAEDGYDYGDKSDAEMLDAIVYNVFPNFAPWGGYVPNIVYRWRPNGWDSHSCLMEVMFLKRVPKGTARPRPAPYRLLGDDEAWSDAAELGALGPIFDQDMGNLPYVQAGMRASKRGHITLAGYQESRVRQMHQTLMKYIDGAL
ncbi:MAG: aromatic ring-hydroxylating dioxygenase subunit alpha [Pseudomonadota bacterium]